MKPAPFILETDGADEIALIDILDDSSLIHDSPIEISNKQKR